MRCSPWLLPLCTVSVVAQQFVVVPNGYDGLEATSAARTPLGWSAGRVQYLVEGGQLCATTAVITNLRLRLDGGNFNVDAPVAKSFQCTIDAYEVPIGPGGMSPDWAINIGAAVATNVYSGMLNVPAATRQLPYPNPWSVDIPLASPLVYSRANGNLLLDITLTGGSGDNWPADGFFFHASEARGEVTKIHEDTACTTAAGFVSLDVPQVLGNGVVGGSLQVNHTATAVAGASIDFVLHLLSLDNRQAAGASLPLALGALSAPACLLNVDPQISAIVPGAVASQVWTLPGAPAVVGVPLFTQAVGVDFAAGVFVPSRNSWQIRIGAAAPLPGPAQMVHRSNYSGQSTGALSPTGYYGLVMGFVGVFQ